MIENKLVMASSVGDMNAKLADETRQGWRAVNVACDESMLYVLVERDIAGQLGQS